MKSWICPAGHKNDLKDAVCFLCGAETTVVEKVKKPIANMSHEQASIKAQLTRAYVEKALVTNGQTACSGCEQAEWDDHDHTISQKRCKDIGKPELITNLDNFEYSCRQCHNEWEGFKSGEFRNHKNFARRMEFMKEHDYQSYVMRMEVIELFNKPQQTI